MTHTLPQVARLERTLHIRDDELSQWHKEAAAKAAVEAAEPEPASPLAPVTTDSASNKQAEIDAEVKRVLSAAFDEMRGIFTPVLRVHSALIIHHMPSSCVWRFGVTSSCGWTGEVVQRGRGSSSRQGGYPRCFDGQDRLSLPRTTTWLVHNYVLYCKLHTTTD